MTEPSVTRGLPSGPKGIAPLLVGSRAMGPARLVEDLMPPDSRFHTQRLTQAPLYELSWFWVREVGGRPGDACAPGVGVYRPPRTLI